MSGANIDITQHELHLGNYVGEKKLLRNIDRTIQDLTYRTNLLMSRFGNCPFNIRLKLFYSYCTSFYGSPLYNLSLQCKSFNKINVTFRKCIKRVMKLNIRTKSLLIAPLTKKPELRTQLFMRLCKFLKNCLSSSNQLIRPACTHSINSFSHVGKNFRSRLAHTKLNPELFKCLPCSHALKLVEIDNQIPDHVTARCQAITELCHILDGTFELNVFDVIETRSLLDIFCTSDDFQPP